MSPEAARPHVSIERMADRHLAVLRLVNPARKNAISATMWREIAAFADAVSADAGVRAVMVMSGAGFFSAGADISDFATARSGSANAASYDDLVEETCRKVEAIAQPTLCLLQGPCYGAGASLAAACDMRVATPDTRFVVPAARLGLGYDLRGIDRFRRVFGPAATAALLFTANALPAAAALGNGAVHALFEADVAEAEAFALADRIAANAPLTVRAAKLALRALSSGDADLRAAAFEAGAAADASADYREGRAAFAEKRTPNFTGA